MLRGVDWQMVTDVSGQSTGVIFKSQSSPRGNPGTPKPQYPTANLRGVVRNYTAADA
jgi:hypothetical protein